MDSDQTVHPPVDEKIASPHMWSGESRIFVLHRDLDADDLVRAIGRNTLSKVVRLPGLQELWQQTGDSSGWGCVVVDLAALGGAETGELGDFMRDRPNYPVIVWSSQLDVPTAVDAMKWGALDVLSRPSDDGDLAAVVQRGVRIARERLSQMLEHREVLSRFKALTSQERTVLSHVMGGKTNKQIASMLDCSLRTVEARRHRIQRVMRAENAVELAVILARHGMLGESSQSEANSPQPMVEVA